MPGHSDRIISQFVLVIAVSLPRYRLKKDTFTVGHVGFNSLVYLS
jgi:hypothetical protein